MTPFHPSAAALAIIVLALALPWTVAAGPPASFTNTTVAAGFGVPTTGVAIIVDGRTRTTPYTWQSIVNGSHGVIAPASQTVGGTPYVFDSWSDGLPASHGFVTPATPFTLTATYVPG